MTDREKVIAAYECSNEKLPDKRCEKCPFGYEYLDQTGDNYFVGCNTERMMVDAIDMLRAQEPITGETSDGYHTFNELYNHRAVLFSVIVANYKDRAWKSVRHHDGTMYDGMFIVGIDTPDGQATYHYDIDPYWDMFDCKVREFAPEWDGHTPAQAIERIGKLKAQEPRVMTLEEWENLPEPKDGECLCYEINDGSRLQAMLIKAFAGSVHLYGKAFRCWTSRPDEKRRAETPWDC